MALKEDLKPLVRESYFDSIKDLGYKLLSKKQVKEIENNFDEYYELIFQSEDVSIQFFNLAEFLGETLFMNQFNFYSKNI